MTPSKDNTFLSIIVPVYNETDRLGHLKEIYDYFKNQKYSTKIIVVNDGSTDDTEKKLQNLKQKFPFEMISYFPNRGKGYAIKMGMLAATGEYHLFTDIDLSTPIVEIDKFIPYLPKNDLVIGTRKNQQANVVIHQHLIRENLGKIFTLISQILLGVETTDFTCGFKCFSQKASTIIFPRLKIERWGFDSEILFIAKKHNLSTKEIPVVWKNDFRSKVRFPQDIINSARELLTIITNDRFRNLYL